MTSKELLVLLGWEAGELSMMQAARLLGCVDDPVAVRELMLKAIDEIRNLARDRKCEWCGECCAIDSRADRKTCSDACRAAMFRAKQKEE